MKLNGTTLRIVKMLKLVSKKPDGITLDEIYAKLDMSETSAYGIVITLIQTGVIHVVRRQKQRYATDLTACRIGINYTNSLDFIGTTNPVLETSPKKVGKTVFFGICSDGSVAYIYRFRPENPIITTATVEAKNPIYYTSLGRVIMVYAEDEDRDDVLSRISFKKHTDRTICTREEFERKLESVRERGYTFDARELEEHMGCMGTPVFGQDGNVMGVISVSSLYKPIEDYDALGCLVSDKEAQLSRLLRYIRYAQENKLTSLLASLLTNHVTAIRI